MLRFSCFSILNKQVETPNVKTLDIGSRDIVNWVIALSPSDLSISVSRATHYLGMDIHSQIVNINIQNCLQIL
jgi:hypothetical protein